MASAAEQSLIALLADEQRGLRRILFAGIAVLVVLVVMSGVLGAYYYFAAQRLELALNHQAFNTQRALYQIQTNIAHQQVAFADAYQDIASHEDIAVNGQTLAPARDAASNYLTRGTRLTAYNDLLLRAAATKADAPQEKALLAGVVALSDFALHGEAISANANDPLPLRLSEAQEDFQHVASGADSALAPVGHAGLAAIYFQIAQSGRSNFAQADCQHVFDEVGRSGVAGAPPGPQPLYWEANCQRKLGHAAEALAFYTQSAKGVPEQNITGDNPDRAELTLAQNAFHGIGTTLIALGATAANNANLSDALLIAHQRCTGAAPPPASASPQMQQALACLSRAIALRRQQRQSENEVAGTQENLGFAYLRDRDFDDAYRNAASVHQNALNSWNELVRALSAKYVQQSAQDQSLRQEAAAASTDARRNVAFLPVGSFNVCELQALLNPDLFSEATDIIKDAHPGEQVSCQRG
ncbi:MAG: hypothetical protein ABUS48_00170 [Pseudomonadota bacterium]